MHNINFTLRQFQKTESYSLHSWAKKGRKRFEKDGYLSFTPGISKFTVTKYICSPFQWTLPFEVDSKIKISDDSKTLKFRIFLKNSQVAGQYLKVTDFIAKIYFPKYLTGSTTSSVDEKSEFLLDENTNVGKWTIGTLKPSTDYEINGLFNLPSSFVAEDQEVTLNVCLNMDIQSYIISGAWVESIKLRDMSHPIDVMRGLKSTTHVKDLNMRITVVKE